MKMSKNNKKALSAGLAVAILVTGTFAWQSFSQYALNKTSGPELTEEPGGRLHDDFDGSNKDVYVENYASVEDGIDVYARVRLDEYFEYGSDSDEIYGLVWDDAAGDYIATTDRAEDLVVVRGDILNEKTPVREDETTWDTYSYGSVAVGAANNMATNTDNGDDALTEENIRVYRDLAFGGSTSYLPTFNKDIASLESDINGTYAGPDGDEATHEDRYEDYTKYVMGESIKGDASFREDFENLGSDLSTEATEHVVSKTEVATVMSMLEWKQAGSPVGAYWVYDTDGWAYYAKGIKPQAATGLLLDNIQVTIDPDNNWFYGINVVAQIATAGDWGTEADEDAGILADGMYADGITEDGLEVLNKASGNIAITNVSIIKAGGLSLTNDDLNVAVGSSLSLDVNVSVYNSEGSDSEKAVSWTIVKESGDSVVTSTEVNATLSKDGIFEPTSSMKGDKYRITATSLFDPEKSDSIIVTVVE